MDHHSDPIIYLERIYLFMKKFVDSIEDKKIKAITDQMFQDYDNMYTTMGQYNHNIKDTNKAMKKSITKLNNIISNNEETITQVKNCDEKEKQGLKEKVFYLVDQLEERKRAIVYLNAENQKMEFELKSLVENQMGTSIVESRLKKMGKIFFDQMSH